MYNIHARQINYRTYLYFSQVPPDRLLLYRRFKGANRVPSCIRKHSSCRFFLHPPPLCQIGPHGAGLFHIIFAPDRAHLIELQIDQTTARKHFNNLAKWSGHLYTARGSRNPVDVGGTQAVVRQAIDGMDLSNH